jgi:hypothetical protein
MISVRRTKLLALLLFTVAAFLRLAAAVRPGLWSDEVFSLAIATGHSIEHAAADANPVLGDFIESPQPESPTEFHRYLRHDQPPSGLTRVIRAVLLSDTNPPLYYLLLNGWTRALGTSDAALRLFSVLLALASFPLLWVLGREMGGRRTAWSAAALFTLAPVSIDYSIEGRMYSLIWFFGLALALLTYKLARAGSRPNLLVLWTISGAAGLLIHYFFAFVWLACFISVWLQPGKVKRAHLTLATALTGLIILPWYVHVPESLGRWRVTGDWLSGSPPWFMALAAPFALPWRLLFSPGLWSSLRWVDGIALGLCLLLIFALWRNGLWRCLFRRRSILLWLWLLASCLGPSVFDLLRNTSAALVPRYAIPGMPAAMLLAGLAMSRLHLRANLAFLALFLLAYVPGIWDLFSHSPRLWEPYAAVGATLAAATGPSDLILVHSVPAGVLATSRYLDTSADMASWVVQLGTRQVPGSLKVLLDSRRKVALVKIDDIDKPSPAEAWLREHASLIGETKWGRKDLTPGTLLAWLIGNSQSAKRDFTFAEILYFAPAQGETFFPFGTMSRGGSGAVGRENKRE